MSRAHEDGLQRPAKKARTNTRLVPLLVALLLCTVGPFLLWRAYITLCWWERRSWMREQIAEIKSGEDSGLFNPPPQFVDLVMNDPECVGKVQSIGFLTEFGPYPVSDQRLAPLGQLPNLRSVTLNETVGTSAFLECLRGNESIARVGLYSNYLSNELMGVDEVTDEGIESIAQIPNLEYLVIWRMLSYRSDLTPLRDHPGLRSVELWYYRGDAAREPIPSAHLDVLGSLPSLRFLSLWGGEITDETMETLKSMSGLEELSLPATLEQAEELRRALPELRYCRDSVDGP